MKTEQNRPTGITLLIQKFRKEFQIPENLNYYSDEDYSEAEKKYLKWCLLEGKHRNLRKPSNFEN